jgi:acyl-CoA synthetase (AMP-forming)/AMP-acid ligase II
MHWKSHELFFKKFQPFGLREKALSTSYAMAENVFAVTQAGIEDKVTVDIIDQQAFMTSQEALSVLEHAHETTSEAVPVMKMLSAGRPIAGTRIRVLSSDGQDLPDRQIGEIALQSNCLLIGYYHRPDLTEKAFIEGWYLTGDLGYLANGELFVTGRKKDLIIVGGKNIYPQDIENLACEVDGIHPGRIVAFGVFNEDIGTEDIVLIAEIDDDIGGSTNSAVDTQQNKREQIARQIRLRVTQGSEVALRNVYLVRRNWLIKTSSGKIARSANKAKYLEEIG